MDNPPSTSLETIRPQPWLRYGARFFDLFFAGAFFGLVPGFASLPEYGLALLIPFLWIFIETIFLSSIGTTPGKWFFSTYVINQSGVRPEFSQALKRSLRVWIHGEGIGIPILALPGCIFSYRKLKKDGKTFWDEKGQFQVIHKKIKAWKAVAFVSLWTGFIVLILISAFSTKSSESDWEDVAKGPALKEKANSNKGSKFWQDDPIVSDGGLKEMDGSNMAIKLAKEADTLSSVYVHIGKIDPKLLQNDYQIQQAMSKVKGDIQILGWNARKIDDDTYLVTYAYSHGDTQSGWPFEVKLSSELVRSVLDDPELEAKYGWKEIKK